MTKRESHRFKVGDELITDKQAIANKLCDLFYKVLKIYSDKMPKSKFSPNYFLKARNPFSIFLNPTDKEEIYKIIDTMKCKSSFGYDGISSSFAKDVKEHLAYPLEIPLNKSLATGIVQDLIKLARYSYL